MPPAEEPTTELPTPSPDLYRTTGYTRYVLISTADPRDILFEIAQEIPDDFLAIVFDSDSVDLASRTVTDFAERAKQASDDDLIRAHEEEDRARLQKLLGANCFMRLSELRNRLTIGLITQNEFEKGVVGFDRYERAFVPFSQEWYRRVILKTIPKFVLPPTRVNYPSTTTFLSIFS